jgi:hypothetical protein
MKTIGAIASNCALNGSRAGVIYSLLFNYAQQHTGSFTETQQHTGGFTETQQHTGGFIETQHHTGGFTALGRTS